MDGAVSNWSLDTLVAEALDLLAKAGDPGESFLMFSGGKDSLALLHLAKLAGISPTVVWINTGFAFAETETFIRETVARYGFELEETPHDLMAVWREHGLPSRIMPESRLAYLKDDRDRPAIRHWMHCCFRRGQNWLSHLPRGSRLLIGQKSCDPMAGLTRSQPARGASKVMPIWNWSDENVLAFLDAEAVPLPVSYADVSSSLECRVCPAMKADKFAYLSKRHPDSARTFRSMQGEIQRAVQEDVAGWMA